MVQEEIIEDMSRLLHGKCLLNLTARLNDYAQQHKGDEVFLEPDTYLSEEDDKLIPDAVYVRSERRSIFQNDRQSLIGAPNIVIEAMSGSSYYKDTGNKKERYARNGVEEYWIIIPELETLIVLENRNGTFHVSQRLGTDDVLTSKSLEGLNIDLHPVLGWRA